MVDVTLIGIYGWLMNSAWYYYTPANT